MRRAERNRIDRYWGGFERLQARYAQDTSEPKAEWIKLNFDPSDESHTYVAMEKNER